MALKVEIMMTEKLPESIQRWTAQRRAALVMTIIKGETSIQEASRQHGLTVAEIEEGRDRFVLGAENALRSKARDEEAMRQQEVNKLQRKVGIAATGSGRDRSSKLFCERIVPTSCSTRPGAVAPNWRTNESA